MQTGVNGAQVSGAHGPEDSGSLSCSLPAHPLWSQATTSMLILHSSFSSTQRAVQPASHTMPCSAAAHLHLGAVGTRRGRQPQHTELAPVLPHVLHSTHHVMVACRAQGAVPGKPSVQCQVLRRLAAGWGASAASASYGRARSPTACPCRRRAKSAMALHKVAACLWRDGTRPQPGTPPCRRGKCLQTGMHPQERHAAGISGTRRMRNCAASAAGLQEPSQQNRSSRLCAHGLRCEKHELRPHNHFPPCPHAAHTYLAAHHSRRSAACRRSSA